ncbi:hypothetical protein H7F15_17665 [Pontibacter sp. Tf4]|uniref:hypothetical protein n=1 Tax=Pontibacter sp. Tf4 TaxID=2761620 RepID=UPI00162A2CFD|nr:hypothetical protein [Pontibacter sp. Tf4]MBB6612874.1 hypothetical protein [Pontibacter sp. Tf4]
MFVSLHTRKQLSRIKQNMLLLGLFLLAGGGYAIVREFLWLDAVRPGWLLAAVVLVLIGGVGVAVGINLIPLQDTFFSMNSSQLGFRLTLFGKAHRLRWTQIRSIDVTEDRVIFSLRQEKEVTLHLAHISDPKIARHIQASISLAALEQNVKVNGVLAHPARVAV